MIHQELLRYLNLSQRIAKLAGTFLAKKGFSKLQVNSNVAHDIKLKADVESERLILKHLQRASNFSILSEEKGEVKGKRPDLCWIVDPIDGTLNYYRQVPMCCVSIGLWQKEKPLLGVIYDFYRKEMFSGISGKMSWLNGRRIRVSRTSVKSQAMICTGFPSKTDYSAQGLKKFVEYVQKYKKVRLLGSAALSLAYVACGRVDAYYEKDIMLWDIAAGLPIISGAGGKVLLEKAGAHDRFHIFASNSHFSQG